MYLVVPAGGCFRETRRIELGARLLTIGRHARCDVRVDIPGVDDEHAKISEVALIAIGTDCAIGDVPLDPGARRLVTVGDEIQIGSIVVALEGEDPNEIPRSPNSAATLVLETGRPRPEAPRVRVVEGPNFGDELILREEGRAYVIGRHAKCDLPLDDREVSREHVKLVRRAYQIFLQDLTSTRGSWLGRAAVYSGTSIEWTRPRMLRVGASVLSLELPEEVRRAAPPPTASAPMTPPPRAQTLPLAAIPSAPSSGAPPAETPGYGESDPSATDDGAHGRPAPANDAASPLGTVRLRQGVPGRRAWKKTGPRIGRASGMLLLALAGLAILGALFVVFSLLE